MGSKRGVTMMKTTALMVSALIALFLVGCAATNLESSKDHTARVKRNMSKDCKNIVEDWDRFWMCDKPSRETPDNM
jgi:hypothetical protein